VRPSNITEEPAAVRTGDRWTKTIWAGEYPDAPMDGFLEKLYAAAETRNTDIAIHIDPRDTRATLDTLENRIENLQADYEYLTEKHRASARGVEKDLSDHEEMYDVLRNTPMEAFDEDVQADTSANQCPECGGHVTTNSVETVCEDCGLVLESQPIDHGPEWREFGDDETDPKRTGAPLTPARHDRGLSTEIGRKTDGNGNGLSGSKRCQLGRLRREHNRGRWRSKAERNLVHGLTEARRIASALGLPESIRDQACALYRSASSEDLLRGRSIETIAAASVYAACR